MSVLLAAEQVAHGQYVDLNGPNGPIRARGFDPTKEGLPPVPAPNAKPGWTPRTVAVNVSGTLSPGKTAWLTASHLEDLSDAHELDTIALPARPLPDGVVLMGATFGPSGILLGFALLGDHPVTLSESLRVLLIP